MSLTQDLRYTLALRRFIRRPPLTTPEARSTLLRWLETREDRFLDVIERAVYDNPSSPYLFLLRRAGCELGDVRRMVTADGLETTLQRLHSSGVYLTFDEFKGRSPIVRDGEVYEPVEGAFRNPLINAMTEFGTGGSTGRAERLPMDLRHMDNWTVDTLLSHDAYGIAGAGQVIWRFSLPGDGWGFALQYLRMGIVPAGWFSPRIDVRRRLSFRSIWAAYAVVTAARLAGVSFPRPRQVSLDETIIVARSLQQVARERGACLARASVGVAARTALAAAEGGVDLSGVTFMGASEPPTPSKIDLIRKAGARYAPVYIASEFGSVGLGCPDGVDQTDVHLMQHSLALIRVPYLLGDGQTVQAFCFTSLHETSPLVILNVESDDYGIVEERACGCPWGAMGLETHVRRVYSYRKLTAEGVTLVGTDVEQILEDVLPARFGGSLFDYQLREREDASGSTKLELLVGPDVGEVDPGDVLDEFKRALERVGQGEAAAAGIWSAANTLRVVRERPSWTAAGKFMPIRSAGVMADQDGSTPGGHPRR